MNVTPKQVLSQIKDIEIAVRNGLHVGNIKAVMKEQKAALVGDRHDFRTLTTLT
jgi:hypothetical protein